MPISTIGSNSLNQTSDLTINGQTVGKGGGNVATNTAHGVSALNANTTAVQTTAIGYAALASNTTGDSNNAFGRHALNVNTTGADNVALGRNTLVSNTTGSFNVAVGNTALNSNTTASNNTAVGYQAGYSNTTGNRLVAIGYQAGYSNTDAVANTFVGYIAGNANTTGLANTFVGDNAGYANTTGTYNTFVGQGSGASMTTGGKNTIIGKYNGNQGSLDIRTASNYIVLSDGDGNPKLFNDGTNWTNTGNSFSTTPATQTNAASFISNSTGGSFFFSIDSSTGSTFGQGAYQRNIYSTGTTYRIYVTAGNNGVYLAPSGTSWTSNSDERLKENLVPIENGLAKVASLRAVTGNYIADEDKKSRAFLIAQDLQAVLPEAVDATEPEKLGVSYTDVIPLLVAAIKELKTIVDAQAAEIAELKAKVA